MPDMIEEIRTASREMVRQLGFMGGQFAGTDLSPSAVHSLIEIGAGRARSARDLSRILRLGKSSVSRMLARLVRMGDLIESADPDDGRLKVLHLTETGQMRVQAIHAFGRGQVAGALSRLTPEDAAAVVQGLSLYAGALAPGTAAPIRIVQGYRSGMIGAITAMHARHYARAWGFGQGFETVVAQGLSEFCTRLDMPGNGIWLALSGDEIVGSVAIDGQDMGPGVAHLRWFLMEDGLRGGGAGRGLLAAALGHVDGLGFVETRLWTFAGLAAARHLYETSGFTLQDERHGNQWGTEVLEQLFVRRAPTP